MPEKNRSRSFCTPTRAKLSLSDLKAGWGLVLPFGQTDEYRKKSPLGKIPCWEDGDYVLHD